MAYVVTLWPHLEEVGFQNMVVKRKPSETSNVRPQGIGSFFCFDHIQDEARVVGNFDAPLNTPATRSQNLKLDVVRGNICNLHGGQD